MFSIQGDPWPASDEDCWGSTTPTLDVQITYADAGETETDTERVFEVDGRAYI